jgi:hypothetical protein
VAAAFRESRPRGTLLRDLVDAGGVKGINHGRQGTISTWVHKTQPTPSSSC